MLHSEEGISFMFCDYQNTDHTKQLTDLINHYMTDPMGGCEKLSPQKEQALVNGLRNHPSSFVLFIVYKNEIAGLATCFINFSTFTVKSYINIHDIIIYRHLRGQNLGSALLSEIISIAQQRNYIKVTLEVRDDNTNAKALYQSMGFKDTDPLMHFWTKRI